jgi:hypothetical protein
MQTRLLTKALETVQVHARAKHITVQYLLHLLLDISCDCGRCKRKDNLTEAKIKEQMPLDEEQLEEKVYSFDQLESAWNTETDTDADETATNTAGSKSDYDDGQFSAFDVHSEQCNPHDKETDTKTETMREHSDDQDMICDSQEDKCGEECEMTESDVTSSCAEKIRDHDTFSGSDCGWSPDHECGFDECRSDEGESDECESDECESDDCQSDQCESDQSDECESDDCESDECESDDSFDNEYESKAEASENGTESEDVDKSEGDDSDKEVSLALFRAKASTRFSRLLTNTKSRIGYEQAIQERLGGTWQDFVEYAVKRFKPQFIALFEQEVVCAGPLEGGDCPRHVKGLPPRHSALGVLAGCDLDHAYEVNMICDAWKACIPETLNKWDDGINGELVCQLLFGVCDHPNLTSTRNSLWRANVVLRCHSFEKPAQHCHLRNRPHRSHILSPEDIQSA